MIAFLPVHKWKIDWHQRFAFEAFWCLGGLTLREWLNTALTISRFPSSDEISLDSNYSKMIKRDDNIWFFCSVFWPLHLYQICNYNTQLMWSCCNGIITKEEYISIKQSEALNVNNANCCRVCFGLPDDLHDG